MEQNRSIKIGVVGPCGSGKTTLVLALKQHGYDARHIAQEHSYVPAMWKKLANPDILVLLEASYTVSTQRRKLSWTLHEYNDQLYRLRDARQNADLVIMTDNLSPQEILQQVINFIR